MNHCLIVYTLFDVSLSWIANHMVHEIIHPGQRRPGSAIEGPPQHVETSDSDSEDEEWHFFCGIEDYDNLLILEHTRILSISQFWKSREILARLLCVSSS